ncbi:MAG: DUF499 domain-containing protein [Cenarchaeum sp. SB0665_bin_23]|nr:DUF499 domain-containing protein [Cenarchaeum sp. SB0667_bin_13]MXY61080.1 DUF499 domain-containing protein [Cenarchaeum sp. SB0665_bin_23]MYC80136.1 DUF499 domain-containing protein [Cenarchaeum sp. SB0661_bin_35]MYI51491.1 DUF499 domain-containing protein [Cenarchaeum sp. SB0673_bin_9]
MSDSVFYNNLKTYQVKSHTMRPFHELLEVRPDVRDGTLDLSVYAANLGDVSSKIDKPAAREYQDPKLFREMTYETERMRKALDDIRVRLQEGRGNGVRQLETSFGGGKTHAMIAMYHECTEWNAARIAIDCQVLDTAYTIWGEMERQLDGTITRMTGQVAPSGDKIYELFSNRDRPILILVDEMFNYIKRAIAIAIGNSDLADQTITFMQNLNGQLGSLPNVCLVMSLSNRDDVLKADNKTARTQNEYYEKLQRIAGRHLQPVTISEDNDISHIVRRRLFQTDEGIISDRAQDTIQHCMDKIKEGGLISADDVKPYTTRFNNTYPFTPDVIDILHKRWGSYATFQRTRGVLRLLSLVVHSMLKSKRGWIAPSDIDLSVSAIRGELLKHAGDNTASVVDADIVGSNALARKADGDAGVRCATSIFMYSFPPKMSRGATLEEVKRSSFTDQTPHWVAGDAVGKLKRRCFYLEEGDEGMFCFDITPNINHMIDHAKQNVSDGAVHDAERNLLDGARDGGRFVNIHIWPDETEVYNIPDRPVLQLIICKKNSPEWCKRVVNGTSRSHRIHMNGLIFVLPTDGIVLNDMLRLQLGAESVHSHMKNSTEYTSARRSYVDSEIKRARDALGDELCKKYSVIYIPDRDEGVIKFKEYMFNPKLESNISLDTLLWERLVRDNQIAEKIAPDIARGYGSDADGAYDTMIRIPGNAMPASLEVVRRAFETKEMKDKDESELEPDTPVSGDSTWSGFSSGEIPDKPEPAESAATYERVVYTDVLDAVGLNNIRSVLWAPQNYTLNGFTCNIDKRPDGMYDVRLEVRGVVPDSVVSNIRPTERGHVEIDGGWEE